MDYTSFNQLGKVRNKTILNVLYVFRIDHIPVQKLCQARLKAATIQQGNQEIRSMAGKQDIPVLFFSFLSAIRGSPGRVEYRNSDHFEA